MTVWDRKAIDFVNSDQVELSKYAGKKAQIAFKYTSTTSRAGTYEIKNLKVCEAFFTMTATAPAELPNTAGTGSFDLTVKNAEGYTFTAALKDATQTWISNIAVANNTVSYSVTANTGNARSAIVVVTATNGTTTQKVEVAISQAASASAAQPVTETLNMPTIFSNTKTELKNGTTYNWGGFNVTFTKLNTSTTNYSGGTSGQLRWYKSDILKFAHKDGYKITKIVFTAVSGYVNKPTADSGSVSVSGTTITWTGDAAAVTLTASSGQIRFTKIAITYIPEGDGSGDEPAEPVQLEMGDITFTATENSLNFDWADVANASSYSVVFNGGAAETVNQSAYTKTGLTAGTKYTISVTAVGDGTNYTNSVAKTIEASTNAATTTPDEGEDDGDETIDPVTMTIAANKGTLNGKEITWTSGALTVKNNQGTSSNAIRTSDTDHFRAYQGSVLTFVANKGAFTKIEVTCTESKYVSPLVTSLKSAGYTATSSGNVVTITCSGKTEVSANMSEQTRFNKVVATF